MKKYSSWRKIIAFLLVVSICLPWECGQLSFLSDRIIHAFAKEKSITMTEYYNNGNYGIKVQSDTYVSISSPEDFLLFRQCIKDGQTSWFTAESGTIGVRFCQTEDINFADFQAEYSEELKRMVLTKPDGEGIGSVDVAGKCYAASATNTAIAPEELGLSGGVIRTGGEAKEEEAYWEGNFFGNYDGQGHSLSGLFLLTEYEDVSDEDGDILHEAYCNTNGIFGRVIYGCVYNLTLKNICAIEAQSGVLAYMNRGIVKNIQMENITVWSRYTGSGLLNYNNTDGEIYGINIEKSKVYLEAGMQGFFGGIVETQRGMLSNCHSKESVMQDVLSGKEANGTYRAAGWIVGSNYSKMYQCSNSSDIKAKYDGRFGGIAYQLSGDFLSDCSNTGDIIGCTTNQSIHLGGIASEFGEGRLYQCYNQGDILAGENYISGKSTEPVSLGGGACWLGGIVANMLLSGNDSVTKIDGCFNEGKVIASVATERTKAGGIVGYIDNIEDGTIRNCANYGLIDLVVRYQDEEAACGGLIGGMSRVEEIVLLNSYNLGEIGTSNCYNLRTHNDVNPFSSESNNIGGLVGLIQEEEGGQQNLENCFNAGSVYSSGGKLVGTAESGSITACYYLPGDDLPVIKENLACAATDCEEITSALKSILNNWVTEKNEEKKTYYSFKTGDKGYPVFDDTAIPELNSAYKLEEPDIKVYPLVEETPEVTVPTVSFVPTVTGNPEETPYYPPTMSAIVAETPSAIPTISAIVTKAPHLLPTMSAVIVASSEPEISALPAESPGIEGNETELPSQRKELSKQKCKLKLVKNFRVKIKWTKDVYAEGYIIYRSGKKKTGFKEIATASKNKKSYVDAKTKKGRKYYYKVSSYITINGQRVEEFSTVKKKKIPWYRAPIIQLKKGVSPQGQKYVQIILKKYKATNLEIYLKQKGKKFKRLKLNSSKIKAYGGKPKLSYSWKKVNIYFKVRTYQMKKGKKRYSGYSKQKKIRL